jgi:hypothetical protein
MFYQELQKKFTQALEQADYERADTIARGMQAEAAQNAADALSRIASDFYEMNYVLKRKASGR